MGNRMVSAAQSSRRLLHVGVSVLAIPAVPMDGRVDVEACRLDMAVAKRSVPDDRVGTEEHLAVFRLLSVGPTPILVG